MPGNTDMISLAISMPACRLASPHFIQFGKDYEGAGDAYVYATFTAADDGNCYWVNSDNLLLMSGDGKTLLMASSGSFDDYNLTLQKVTLVTD